MLCAYEGYLEEGRFEHIGTPISIEGRRKVIMIILDEDVQEKSDT